MYPASLRSNNNHLAAQTFVSTAPYADCMAYHHLPSVENHGQSLGSWGSHYGLQREDWHAYGQGPSSADTSSQMNGLSPGQVPYSAANYNSPSLAGAAVLPSVDTFNTVHLSPHNQRHSSSYEWMRKTMSANNAGKTRTKEKYRVVYTDQQRLELEKEFYCNRYITIRRKAELAGNLGLSERQVKIWFQNRRAKERKMIKKKISQFDGSGGSVQSDSGSVSPAELPAPLLPQPHMIDGLQPIEMQQVIAAE
ncbi:homeobox protein CDX-4-like [Rhineura floridana]|uniref:homeobox protein CDX-4-like n=1 Tax=Rhineura floridana TaxID=261503 RepID=UPI002AC7EBB1|nr:homeobox protein CDX-4-like [Rhineura floridana]